MVEQQQAWISTGKAAALLGYSPGHFRAKFAEVIPTRRSPGGHLRWLRAAVEALADETRHAS